MMVHLFSSTTCKRMPPSIISNQTEDLVLARLFEGNRRLMLGWLEQTQERIDACSVPTTPSPLSIPSDVHHQDDKAVLMQLCDTVGQTGFALYSWSDTPIDVPIAVTRLLKSLSLRNPDQGVIREGDELSLLQDLSGTAKGKFPPYQSRHMNWHTDGYYNEPKNSVRCFTLHCVEPAAEGGALLLMDDTFLVLTLLRENPNLVAQLCHPQAMTLPHNRDALGHNRPDRSVPMIQRNADGALSVRFTTRTQHIRWRCDKTQQAAERAVEMIEAQSQWHTRLRLEKGQGVITRNVLHAREAFVDAPEKPKRQMLRGRFNQLPQPATSNVGP